jgi:hypothetical protein
MKRRRLLTATVVATVLGGWLLANYGPGVTPAVATPPIKEDPLAGVTQNWDKNLPAAQRFAVLSAFGGDAVRDNETGLVWERSPLITTHVWGVARFECAGGRLRILVGNGILWVGHCCMGHELREWPRWRRY